MRIATVTARIAALPVRHKVAAALLALLIAGGAIGWSLAQPDPILSGEFQSAAVLRYNAPKDPQLAKQLANQGPAELAASILNHQDHVAVKGEAEPSQIPALSQDRAALRRNLTISEIAPATVRVGWEGRGARQTLEETQWLTMELASWQPSINRAAGPEGLVSARPDSQESREESLLKMTIAMLDRRRDELAANTQEKDGQVKLERKRIQRQREIVSERLTELQKQEAPKQSALRAHDELAVQPPAALASAQGTNADPGYVFTVVQNPTEPALVKSAWPMRTLGVLGGLLTGILYLAGAAWWFRPVSGVAGLEGILPRGILVVGTIAEIRR